MEEGKLLKYINKRNEEIFWDLIMPRKNLSNLAGKDVEFKYHLNDVTKRLRGKNVNINAWVEFDPVFGWIHRVKLISIN